MIEEIREDRLGSDDTGDIFIIEKRHESPGYQVIHYDRTNNKDRKHPALRSRKDFADRTFMKGH